MPEPPGPVSVTRREPFANSDSTSSTSISRPTNKLAGPEGPYRDRLKRREARRPELEDGHRPFDVLQPVLDEMVNETPSTSARDAARNQLPTMPGRRDARREVHVVSHIALVHHQRNARVETDTQLDRPRREKTGHRLCRNHGTDGRSKGEKESVTLRVNLDSALGRARIANHATCSASASAYASSPSSRRSRVDPSTSVKRKVTVPLGRSDLTRRDHLPSRSASPRPPHLHDRSPLEAWWRAKNGVPLYPHPLAIVMAVGPGARRPLRTDEVVGSAPRAAPRFAPQCAAAKRCLCA